MSIGHTKPDWVSGDIDRQCLITYPGYFDSGSDCTYAGPSPFITRTMYGKAMRAISMDLDCCRLMG